VESLSGCAAKKTLIWTPTDARVVSEQEFRKDIYECTQQSTTFSAGGGTGYVGLAMMAAAQRRGQEQANELFKICMQARGYSYTEQDAP